MRRSVFCNLCYLLGERGDECPGVPAREAGDSYPYVKRQIHQESFRRLASYLDKLSRREREVINLRYGFGDGYCYSLEDVGKIFDVTRERIRQIEARTIRNLWNLIERHERDEESV